MESRFSSTLQLTVSDETSSRLLAVQVELLHERGRASAWMSLSATLLVFALLWSRMPDALLFGWLGLRLLLVALRLWMLVRFEPEAASSLAHWRAAYTSLLVLDGLSWGLGMAVMAPLDDPVITMLLLAALVAVVAVAGTMMAPHLPLATAYGMAVLLPPAAAQLWRGGVVGTYAGAVLLVFLLLHLATTRIAARQVSELLRLRLLLEDEAQAHARALTLAERHSAVKSQFLATMSHEMRTPLHGMLGLARHLREQALAGASAQRTASTVGLIERSGAQLLGLINDVLDFAKIEAGRMRLADEPFDLKELIEDVAALGGGGARDKGLALEVETDGLGVTGTWMRGDAARVRQVLQNLLGNAIKFTESGRVRIKAVRHAATGRVRIDVEDSGVGIAAARLEHIFEAFYQVEGEFDRRHGGTGLGLTIARELARAMGGDLRARSRIGVGSVFSFEAPLPPALPDTQPQEVPVPPAPRRLVGRVLVAEDNPVNALVVEAMLRQFGLEVELVENGAQAVDRWQHGRPDLLLMDCQMPELDGFAATGAIRAREEELGLPRVPIVALTANAFESDRERCLEAGMDEYLAKPFREEELRALLACYLLPIDADGIRKGVRPDIIV